MSTGTGTGTGMRTETGTGGSGGARTRASGPVTAVVGTVLEAWDEVRVHRSRVVLSLVGVFLAVFAMTIVTAAGEMGRQAVVEAAERSGGRTTTLSLSASPVTGSATPAEARRVYADLVRRFGIGWSSTVVQASGPDLADPARQGAGGGEVQYGSGALLVEPAWAVIHRVSTTSGRFLVAGDAQRMVPAVVLNGAATEVLGTTGQRPPYAVELGTGGRAVVVGTVTRDEYYPEVISLPEGPSWLPAEATSSSTPTLELWVPPQRAEELTSAVTAALAARGWSGEPYPSSDPGLGKIITVVQWGIRAISLFALLLGAVGVLNVGVVTVRQRVREIGVRRALGASSARVFAAIVLESVVATALAGALGVALAVAIVTNLPLDLLAERAGISDVPPFPASAALEAFCAATAVGALAGLVPALIAVRAKVIDAIRY